MYNFLNIIALGIFFVFLYRFYQKYTSIFILLLLPITFFIQIVVSDAYIETGIELIDIGEKSYFTGSTIRLVLIMIIMYFTLSIMFKIFKVKKYIDLKEIPGDLPFILICLIGLVFIYLFADSIISTNILSSSLVTRFNFYNEYSTLPFSALLSYLYSPFLLVLGYIMVKNKTKFNIVACISLFAIFIATRYLTGIQFGGYFIGTVMFFTPFLIEYTKKHNILKPKYIVVFFIVILILLIPKYMYFVNSTIYDNLNMNSGYEKLMYRLLAQNADMTWKIDNMIINGYTDSNQFFIEIKSIFVSNYNNVSGVKYLMNIACPSYIYDSYELRGSAITGGYPLINCIYWGYSIGIILIVFDVIIYSLLIIYIVRLFEKGFVIRIFFAMFIYTTTYTIIMQSGLNSFNNILPQTCILTCIFFECIFRNKAINFYLVSRCYNGKYYLY